MGTLLSANHHARGELDRLAGRFSGVVRVFLPVFIVYAVVMALGPALYLASLNVRYRDFRFIVPFVVQFGLYISPVGFSSEVVPDAWRLLYSLNPAVSAIDGFRWCILGGEIWWPGFCCAAPRCGTSLAATAGGCR
jgi:ABC-type polysaccharide/polyol phosphate export permease